MNKKYLLVLMSTAVSLPITSYGLGIGGINVSSNLGEPFRASINITNAPADLESDCFKLSHTIIGSDVASSSFNANLSLKKISADDYKLFITTGRPIDEPAIDLILSSECGNLSTRQYTVLLDPSMDSTASTGDSSTVQNQASTEQTMAASSEDIKPENTKPKSTNNKRRVKKSKPVIDGQMSQTVFVPAQVPVTPPTPITQSRLVISVGTSQLGTSSSGSGASYLSLQLDNNLHEITPPTPEQLASLNDSLDDMTAMSKTIDSLKLQVAQLEKRNLELELSNSTRPNNIPTTNLKTNAPAPADTGTPWLLYLLIAGLIAAALFAFDFMRRRKRKMILAADLDFNDTPFAAPEVSAAKKVVTPAFEHSSFGNSTQYLTKAQIGIENDTKDDVLREVEVFMALGRNNLAIKLLQANVREFPKDSPSNWLLLLDLLKQENLPTEYADTTAKCQKIFNIYIAPFGEVEEPDNSSLEDHPHIEEKLEEIWGTNHMSPFLEELIYNSRSEARRGFRKNVYLELLLLHKIALDRDRYDDSHVQTAMSSSTMLDDTALKAKFDEVYSQGAPNTGEDKVYSVASDLDAEISKLEAATVTAKDPDAFDLDLPADFATLGDVSTDNNAGNPLDIPLEFETINHNTTESNLEFELAKFAAEQAEYDKNIAEINSFDLSDELTLELPSDSNLTSEAELLPVKPKKKTTKKADVAKDDDAKPDSFDLDFKI